MSGARRRQHGARPSVAVDRRPARRSAADRVQVSASGRLRHETAPRMRSVVGDRRVRHENAEADMRRPHERREELRRQVRLRGWRRTRPIQPAARPLVVPVSPTHSVIRPRPIHRRVLPVRPVLGRVSTGPDSSGRPQSANVSDRRFHVHGRPDHGRVFGPGSPAQRPVHANGAGRRVP